MRQALCWALSAVANGTMSDLGLFAAWRGDRRRIMTFTNKQATGHCEKHWEEAWGVRRPRGDLPFFWEYSVFLGVIVKLKPEGWGTSARLGLGNVKWSERGSRQGREHALPQVNHQLFMDHLCSGSGLMMERKTRKLY